MKLFIGGEWDYLNIWVSFLLRFRELLDLWFILLGFYMCFKLCFMRLIKVKISNEPNTYFLDYIYFKWLSYFSFMKKLHRNKNGLWFYCWFQGEFILFLCYDASMIALQWLFFTLQFYYWLRRTIHFHLLFSQLLCQLKWTCYSFCQAFFYVTHFQKE